MFKTLSEFKNTGDIFWREYKLSKKRDELTPEDYNHMIWSYHRSSVLMGSTLYSITDTITTRVQGAYIKEMFGFEVTDVFKGETVNSMGGNLYVFHVIPQSENLTLYHKYPRILFEWSSRLHSWVNKWGTDNNNLYLCINSAPFMSYELYDY